MVYSIYEDWPHSTAQTSLVPRIWHDAQAGLSCSLVHDSDYMLDVDYWDELDIRLGQAYAVCKQASALGLLVKWQSSVCMEAVNLQTAAQHSVS